MRSVLFGILCSIAAVMLAPQQAMAACDTERGAFLEEWKANRRYDLLFDEYHGVLVDAMKATPEWSNAQELAKALTEQPEGIPPAELAFMQCTVRERVAELEGQTTAPANAGSAGRGPSSFASGGDVTPEVKTVTTNQASPGCGLESGDADVGILSTDSVTIHNTCRTRVSYAYCVTSENGGGTFSCDQGKFGTDSVEGEKDKYFSVSGASSPFQIHFAYCVADNNETYVSPSRPRWNGTRVEVDCN